MSLQELSADALTQSFQSTLTTVERDHEAFAKRASNAALRDGVLTRLRVEEGLLQEEKDLLKKLCLFPTTFGEEMIEACEKILKTRIGLQLAVTVLNASLRDVRMTREALLDEREMNFNTMRGEGLAARVKVEFELRKRGVAQKIAGTDMDPMQGAMKEFNRYDRKLLAHFNDVTLPLVQNLIEADKVVTEKFRNVLNQEMAPAA